MLFILCGATGMRIGEILGLEIDKHFADDFTTILVRQQAKGSTLTRDVKTKNAIRDIGPSRSCEFNSGIRRHPESGPAVWFAERQTTEQEQHSKPNPLPDS